MPEAIKWKTRLIESKWLRLRSGVIVLLVIEKA